MNIEVLVYLDDMLLIRSFFVFEHQARELKEYYEMFGYKVFTYYKKKEDLHNIIA